MTAVPISVPEVDARGLRVQHGPGPSLPSGPADAMALLRAAAAAHPDREALVGRYARFTYADLADEVDRAAAALVALGVRPGDRVAAALPNHTDIVVAFLASLRLGAIWLGVNLPLAPPEKAYLLADAGASVLLADDATVAQLAARRGELPELRHTVVVDPAGGDEWHPLVASATPLDPADHHTADHHIVDPHAPAAIAYTSGTTGFPKGAVHSQHNLLLPGAVARSRPTYDPELRQGVCLPLTILNLLVLGPLTTIQLGSALVCMDRVDPLGMAEWIRDERIATFSAVPAMVHGLLTHPEVTPEHLVSLVRPGVGGADLPDSFRSLYRERFGGEVTIGYGLTEAPTAVTVTDPTSPPIPHEAGTALPQVEVVVVDDEGNDLPPGETGEICVRARREGPWAGVYTPMLGYWGKPEATREALRGGILHTGDLGYLDADGHLFVRDRRNDLIIRGGANVYPAEVERVLHLDPRVGACAVLGVPDERLGERVAAFVELAPGATATGDELAAACAEHLARYKVPERWTFVDALPRTPMGKVRKADLR